MASLGLSPGQLDAVLVTHEHGDHIRGVPALVRKYGMPVWMTTGTSSAGDCSELPGLHLFHCHDNGFRLGELRVLPYAVPHDAREPSQFVFQDRERRLGLLTDTGAVTPHMLQHLGDVDALVLECNHDSQMLARGPYPPSLQRRVGGFYGHLNNQQAADLLLRMDRERFSWLVAAHISEKNNHPDKASETLLNACPDMQERLVLAKQNEVMDWLEV